ncbi:MAG: diacylglycerol kinase family protein [bacterium]|nr:diacylglycerol kinase family protein [bacterium]
MKNKSKKLINSFKYAINGVFSAFFTERNMKIHVSMMLLVIFCGILLKIEPYEWLICILCFGLVIGGELVNTAIETVVDLVMPDINEQAKKAKDIAAGSVLVVAIASAIIGLLIFIPKILAVLF